MDKKLEKSNGNYFLMIFEKSVKAKMKMQMNKRIDT